VGLVGWGGRGKRKSGGGGRKMPHRSARREGVGGWRERGAMNNGKVGMEMRCQGGGGRMLERRESGEG